MFEKVETFPDGWFFIKNQQNGYVLSIEDGSHSAGSPVVLSSLRAKEADAQLWRTDDQQRLVNKKTGQVMDIAHGKVKTGSDVVQQIAATTKDHHQSFGLSEHGHIYVKTHDSLVLGIKESFFSRREGLHVHLQLADKKHLDKKEQRWDFVLPVVKQSSSIHSSVASLKKSNSISSVGSLKHSASASTIGSLDDTASVSSSVDDQDEGTKSVVTGSFPTGDFFLKSVTTGYYVGTEANTPSKSGTRLTIDSFRKTGYETQLWSFNESTHHIVNKKSGLLLTVEDLKDDNHVCQASPSSSTHQEWQWTKGGQLCLKNDSTWVLGFKDSWFSLNREGAHIYVQKTSNKQHQHQNFQVVLPVFKKRTTTSNVADTSKGQFPEGWFFVKSQSQGLVLSVLESGALAAQVTALRLDTANYARQLWKYKDGFLVNKASGMVLDIKGGSIVNGALLCQYKEKKKDNDNQQWALNMDGSIYVKAKNSFVLTVQENEKVRSRVFLSEQHSNGAKEQRWNFVLPVFKKKQSSKAATTTTTIKKTVVHRYAQYPRGWFFIRSFLPGATLEAPQVLTANEDRQGIHTAALDRENWHAQLWTYVGGTIVNYETQLAIDVNGLSAGETVKQANQQNQHKQQLWSLTVDGHFIHISEPTLALVPKDNKLVLSHVDQVQLQTYRWGFLIPEFTVQHRVQVLLSWKMAILKEWRNISAGSATSSRVQKLSSAVAIWPQETFFITGPNGDALVPAKSEALSGLTVRTLTVEEHSAFQWCFKNGYLVHVATGLVLHSQDLADGTRLEIRSQHVGKDGRADERQQWTIKTDGSIVSGTNSSLGLGGRDVIELVDTKKSRQHISWSVFYGHYEKDTLTRFRRYILSMASQRSLSQHQLVTKTYGVFPKKWIFIRSKQDSSLVLTASNSKKGAKLVLAKLDFKNYKQQLWHTRDDQCLVNFATDFVIDVAGGQLSQGNNIIQWNEKFLRRHRKNQMWGLSVDGHIHPDSRSGLVLAPKKTTKAHDGVELSLVARGSLDHLEQQWTFATPVFRNRSGAVISIGLTANKSTSDIVVDGVGEATQTHSDRQTYERTVKKTVVRRWGLFPKDPFFIRMGHGSERYALTVESKPIAENIKEHQVTLRPMNFKAHKWQLWIFRDDHLINAETGLALDIQQHGKDILIEEGLQAPACVREVSMDDSQFFALGVHGEIHSQSNSRMIVTVANKERLSVDGAQIGLKSIKVSRVVSENKQVASLVSEEWMRWALSTPVYRKTTTTTTSSSVAAGAAAAVAAGAIAGAIVDGELESCEDHKVDVQEQDESADETDSEADTTEDDSESDSDDELLETEDDDKFLTDASASDSGLSSTSATSSKRRSRREGKKDSFVLAAGYIPSGFEKIVRFKTHQAASFPETGYFFIKSDLHGYVLDVEGDGITEDAKISLARMRSTDFASQLWSFRDGFLVNLKGDSLVLDGSSDEVTTAGDRVHLSKRKPDASTADDQQWGWGLEGYLYLKTRRSLVLSVKELERSDKHTYIDVYVQEEKTHLKSKYPRPEQRWDILVPSLIPVSPESSSGGAKIVTPPTGHSTSTVVAGIAAGAAATTAIAALSYKWFHKLHRHTTITSQWADNWFMISYGEDNLFLAAGTEKNHSVGIQELGEHDDHKRFLWTFVDGQLINYRYMLRLVLCQKTQRWILVDTTEEKDQVFAIDSAGVITLRILTVVYYLRFVRSSSGAHLLETTRDVSQACQHWQLHTPELADENSAIEATQARTKAHTWIHEQHTVTTTTTTKTWTITRHRAYFPTSPWFFIKIVVNGEEYVLAQDEKKSALVIKKISFSHFKHQLWTWRDQRLVNYGSSQAIGISGSSLVLVSATEGYAWNLNIDGHIHSEEIDQDLLVLGYAGSELQHNTTVELVSAKEHQSKYTLIQWSFSTPVFGKRASSTAASTTTDTKEQTHASITASIEQGAIIDAVESVKVDHAAEQHHDHHTGAKVAVGAAVVAAAGAAAAAVVHHQHHDSDKQSQQPTTAVTTTTQQDHHSTTVVTVTIEEIKTTIYHWYLRFNGRVSARLQQGGDNVKADIEQLSKEAREELVVVIKDSKDKAHKGWAANEKAHAELDVVLGKVQTSVLEQVTEVETVVKTTTDVDVIHKKLTGIADKAKSSIHTHIDASTGIIHSHHDSSKGEGHHHTGAIAAGAIATGVAGAIAVHEHQDKKDSSVKKQEHIVTIVSADQVRETVRTWWLKLTGTIAARAQQEGASAEEINVIITKEKETIFAELDQAIKNSTDKKVAQELTVAVEKSKTLITEQTIEAHAIGVQVITASDKKIAADKLHHLTKETEEKLKVTITQEKVTKVVDTESGKVVEHHDQEKKDHHHGSAIVAGAVAVGAIVAGAAALDAAADHKHKHDEAKKIEEAKVIESDKVASATTVIEEVKVTVFGWYKSLNERIAARLQQGGDNAKTDVERITKEAREELTVIIKDSKDKAHKGWAANEKANAELEVALGKVQTSVLEQVTEVETIVKTTTEVDVIHKKLTAATEKAKTSIDVHLDESTGAIHEHVEEHKSHLGAIAGTIAVGTAVVGGAIAKKHHDDKEAAKKDSDKHHTGVVVVDQGKSTTEVANVTKEVVVVDYVKVTVTSWFARLIEQVSARAKQGGSDAAKDIEAITAKSNAEIILLLEETAKKSGSSTAGQQISSSLTWARGLVAQQSTQIQAIGIQAVAAKDSTGGVATMKAQAKATEQQIHVTLDQCDKTVKSTVTVTEEVAHGLIVKGDTKESAHAEKVTDVEKKHDHHTAKVAAGVAAGVVGAIAVKHEHDDKAKKETESTVVKSHEHEHKTEAVVTIVTVEQVRETVRTWWLKLSGTIAARAQQEGASAEEINVIITKEKETIFAQLDQAIKNSSDKKVAQELTVAVEKSKTLITEQTVEAHAIGVQVITASNKKIAAEKLHHLTKDTEDKLKVTITQEKVTKVVDTESGKVVEHHDQEKKDHHNGSAIAAGAVAVGAIVAGAVAIDHKHKHDEAKKVEEAKVIESDKVASATTVIEEVKVTVFGWYKSLNERIAARLQEGGDNAKTDVERITKEAREELTVIIKDSKDKAHKGWAANEKANAELEVALGKVQTSVLEQVTEVETVVKTTTEVDVINKKLTAATEKAKTSIDVHLDESTGSIHEHVEKHKSHLGAIAAGTVAVGGAIIAKKHHDHKEADKKVEDIVHPDEADATTVIETVKVTVFGWYKSLNDRIAARLQQGGADAKTDVERITKEAREELTVIIKDSKDKAHKGWAANEKANAELEVALGKVQTSVLEQVTEVETVVKTTTEVDVINKKLTAATEKAKTSIDVHLDESTGAIHEHVEKHKSHTRAIAGGVAAGAAIAGTIIAKKHHDHKEAEKKIKEIEYHDDADASTVIETVKVTVFGWYKTLNDRIAARLQQGGPDAKSDVERITKEAREELTVIIKDSKDKAHKGWAANEKANAELEVALGKVQTSVLEQVTEVETVVKTTTEVDVINKKLTAATEKAKTSIDVHLDESTGAIHEHVEKHKSHTRAIAGGVAAGAAIAGTIIAKKHHDHKEAEKKIEEIEHHDDADASTVIETVKVTVFGWYKTLNDRIAARLQQGGPDAKSDVERITKEAREELTVVIKDSKDKAHKGWAANEKANAELEIALGKVQTSVLEQVTEVETVVKTTTEVDVINKKLTAATEKAKTSIDVHLDESTGSIHEHVEKHKSHTRAIAGGVAAGAAIAGTIIAKKHHDHKEAEKKIEDDIIVETEIVTTKPVVTEVETVTVVKVVEDTRNATSDWYGRLIVRIKGLLTEGGVDTKAKITTAVKEAEDELEIVLGKSKSTANVSVVEVENVLAPVHASIGVQLEEIKKSVDRYEVGVSNVELDQDLLAICESGKEQVNVSFVEVSDKVSAAKTGAIVASVAVAKSAQDASVTMQNWFGKLVDKVNSLLEVEDCTNIESDANIVIADAEKEIAVKIEEIKNTTNASPQELEVLLGKLRKTAATQIEVVKTTVSETTTENKQSQQASLIASVNDFNKVVVSHAEAATVKESSSGADKKKTQDHHHLSNIGKVALGSAAVVAGVGAAVALEHHHDKKQKEHEQSLQVVETVEESKVNDIKVTINAWFAALIEKTTKRAQQGGDNVSADIDVIITEAHKELETQVTNYKTHSSQVDTTSKNAATLSLSLGWILSFSKTQTNQIRHIVSQGVSSSSKNKVDIKTQLDNLALVSEQQVNKTLAIHIATTEQIQQTVSVVETKEQIQSCTTKTLASAVEENKVQISGWIDGLLSKVRVIIARGDASAHQDIQRLIESAQQESTVIIQDAKRQVAIRTSTTVYSRQADAKLVTLAANAQKHALDSFDSVGALIIAQLTVVISVLNENHDLHAVDERLSWILTRARQHSEKTLEHTTESAVSIAFEGKTVAWVETTEVPESFGSVKIFAFDLLDTIVDYRGTLFAAWTQLVEKKQGAVAALDGRKLIERWYIEFIGEKQKSSGSRATDMELFRLVLVRLLKEYHVDCQFTHEELQELSSVWERLDVYGDAVSSVRQLKKNANMYAVAVAPALSTRTMMSLARHGCLCWHSQFSSDAAASSSSSVIENVPELLALDNVNELAVVSSNHATLEAAKKQGAHTVLISREEDRVNDSFDLTFDGLDVLAESFQSFVDHQASEKKAQPSRGWFQRVVDTASNLL
ncbi:unnamed protein product [Absidia cylindrospora]